jgi:glycosyltransferase involved in cell wall biosynthesis
MHILLLGGEVKSPVQINCFTAVWSYYFPAELKKMNINVSFDELKSLKYNTADEIISHYQNLDVSQYDHIVALGLRYFSTIPKECGEILLKKVRGCLAQIYDGGLLDTQQVHLNFTFRDDAWFYPIDSINNRYERHHKYNKHIGWAADENLCKPAQDDNELRILVDHSTFNYGSRDSTLYILLNIQQFIKSNIWKKRFQNIRVRQIVDGAIVDCDLNNIVVKPYNRRAVSYVEACEEYSKAHIFFVTHSESVGLTILETAMAGALPIIPKNYAPQDRIDTIRHITFDSKIDWKQIMSAIDIQASRIKAVENSWQKVAERALEHLNNFMSNKNAESVTA